MDADETTEAMVPRLVPLSLLSLLVALSVGAFLVARHVVADQEQRLLAERADEVGAVLSSSINGTEDSLRLLAAVASSPDPAAVDLFTDGAATLAQRATTTVGAAAARDGRFVVVAAVGDGPAAGEALTGARERLAARAAAGEDFVAGLLTEAGATRVMVAVAERGVVGYQESMVDPGRPVPSTPDSPFRELRVALHAAAVADPSKLVLTTEADLPLSGQVERVPLMVGADRWLLSVGARQPLVGSFARNAPWVLLLGGLVCALLAASVVNVLSRRRAYALRLVRDRTAELQVAHDELRDTRAFLEQLLTAGPVLVVRVTLPDRAVSYVSPNVERLFGITEAEAQAPRFLEEVVHEDDRGVVEAAVQRVAGGTSDVATVEYRLHRPGDRRSRWVSATLVPQIGDGGDVVALLAYLLDVDDRRQAEQAHREAQQAAETANRAKTGFLSRMSHELRTPLNAVLGFGQLLELDTLTAEQREAVTHILKAGRHLLDLINEVLDISRVESGDLALSPEAVLASELVHETVDLIRPFADQRGIQVAVDGTSCDCFVLADRQRAKQVLLNLLSNAVKYNRPRGTVAVSCQPCDGTAVRMAVADTGHGIPADRLGMLFTPFERLGAEQTGEEGTGIGLALSRRLAEAMGGALHVSSTFGQGSTFSVELPRVEGPVERYERLTPPDGPADALVAGAPRSTVLHIEDNLANLKLVERVLAQRPGVEVVAAMQGGLGLELARQHRPALVLLDLHLPDMDGDQVLQRLRDHPATASIPVVMVSADATPGQVRRLLSAGAAGYLTKPIAVPELLGLVDEVLVRR